MYSFSIAWIFLSLTKRMKNQTTDYTADVMYVLSRELRKSPEGLGSWRSLSGLPSRRRWFIRHRLFFWVLIRGVVSTALCMSFHYKLHLKVRNFREGLTSSFWQLATERSDIDHLLCLDFSNSIILIYSLTAFVPHIINLTVLQASLGRWPVWYKIKCTLLFAWSLDD